MGRRKSRNLLFIMLLALGILLLVTAGCVAGTFIAAAIVHFGGSSTTLLYVASGIILASLGWMLVVYLIIQWVEKPRKRQAAIKRQTSSLP